MNANVLAKTRRRVGYGVTGLTALGIAWWLVPGLPVLWEPRASASVKAQGQELFEREWAPNDEMAHGDGLGPVFNARSCVACHFQGGVGGGGGNDHNVMAFEAHPTKERPVVEGGLIHKFAIADSLREDFDSLRKHFPIVPGGIRVEGGCQILIRDFDPIQTQSINSSALFGAGWIDRMSSKTIAQQSLRKSLASIGRELQSDFGGVPAGRYRLLPDGRVGKFGWKGQFASLEEFVAAACANEVGLGNPRMPQAKPRVGREYAQVEPDLDAKQFRSLVAFVDTLPRPSEVVSSDTARRSRQERGKVVFETVGCAICHTPEIGGVAGVYSDFLLHSLADRQGGDGYRVKETPEVPLPTEYPRPDEWKTPPLWGVADSAPYFHDGGAADLKAAILRHRGDAEAVTQAYRVLSTDDQLALVVFLEGLKAPAEATPASARVESLAQAK
jgi:mono/diheme cytochrome c family protein